MKKQSPRQREEERQRALKDLDSLKHEGGGFGGGWTQSALVRSLTKIDDKAKDVTPNLRRIIVALRVVAFALLSLWLLFYLTR